MTVFNTRLAAALWLALSASAIGAAARAEPCEGAPGSARLLIDIDKMTSTKGLMTASLYPGDKTQFLVKNGALKVWSVPVTSPITGMCIWLKAPGTYALAVYHDANSNHKLDVSPFGYSERMGFSNNPPVHLAKPSFASAKFVAGEGDTSLQIHLTSGK